MTTSGYAAGRWVRWLAGAALLAAGGAGAGAAHAQAGRVEGVVVDDEGRGLAHAQVVTQAGRGTLTDVRGRFALPHLPAGEHRLRVSLIGYEAATRGVTAGDVPVRVEIRLTRTVLSLPGVQVTATPTGKDPVAVTQATAQLSGRALERGMSGTLAQTLRAQPGVAVRSMGPAATAPVMRGLTGDRVLVLQDGQRTADLAGSADDHGVTIDPLAAQRVEVVRGPATLLYGNNALGGVVNVISGDIPTAVPVSPEVAVGGQAESAYPGGSASAKGSAALGESWAATVRVGARRTGDMRIPADPLLGDRLGNTDARNLSASLGAGHVGRWGTAGAAVRAYDFGYGLPVPPGAEPVALDGRRREASARGEVLLESALITSLRVDGTVQRYGHDELEPRTGRVLQAFSLDTRTLGLVARQGRVGPFAEGAWGASGLLKRYAATGPAALTPPADSRSVGLFGFQELSLPRGAALQLGARVDRYEIESRPSEGGRCTERPCGAGGGPAMERVFGALSGSVGVRVPLAEGLTAAASLARSFRAPTVEELFSGAAHAGTGSVELGDPTLRAERGRAVEVVLRAQRPRWTGQAAVYRNAVDGFVHLRALGDSLVDGVRLPVLGYDQTAAVLQGVEGSVEWAALSDVAVGLMGDYLHAEQADGTPLSYMPPPRLGASARWDDGRLSLGGDVHHEFAQRRTGSADESPTPAHTILRLTAGLRVTAGRSIHSLSLRAENLTNETHREATSRIKDFAPGPGRNLALLYRVYF